MTSYKAFEGMIFHIENTTNYFDDEQDVMDSFRECVMNATLKGGSCPFMKNFTINKSLTRIKNLTEEELPFSMEYQIHSVELEQYQPFTLTTSMNITINVSAKDMRWNFNQRIQEEISIEGLKDPLYQEKGISYNNTFKPARTSRYFFNGTNFARFVEEGRYIESEVTGVFGPDKPYSFFGRLTNDSGVKMESDFNRNLRIISILDPDKTMLQQNQSYVDHLEGYEFTPSQCIFRLKGVEGDTSGARVDKSHLMLTFGFNETDLVDLTC